MTDQAETPITADGPQSPTFADMFGNFLEGLPGQAWKGTEFPNLDPETVAIVVAVIAANMAEWLKSPSVSGGSTSGSTVIGYLRETYDLAAPTVDVEALEAARKRIIDSIGPFSPDGPSALQHGKMEAMSVITTMLEESRVNLARRPK